MSGGSKSTCPSGVAEKLAALIGEQVAEAGPDRRPQGVEPYSRALTDERLGLNESLCDMAWQAAGTSEGAGRKGVQGARAR